MVVLLPLPFAVLAGGSLGIRSSGLPPLGLARSATGVSSLGHWLARSATGVSSLGHWLARSATGVSSLGQCAQYAWILGLGLVLFFVSSIHLVIL